jgi:hypothetical protein
LPGLTFSILKFPLLSARAKLTRIESFLFKTDTTVLTRFLFSELSFTTPFIEVWEKLAELINTKSSPMIVFLMANSGLLTWLLKPGKAGAKFLHPFEFQ